MHVILELVAHQGFVTAHQAAALGVRTRTLSGLVHAGALRRAARGVYLPGAPGKPEKDHAALTRGAISLDPFGVASHQSALALHGIDLYGVRLNQVHLAGPRHNSRCQDRVHHHVWRDGDVITTVGDVRAVEPALACVQVAARYGLAPGVVAMDAALHRGRCTIEDLDRILESGRQRRGIVVARRAVREADGRSESPGESRLRLALRLQPWSLDLQVPPPRQDSERRVDIVVEGLVAVEFDGAEKYEGLEGRRALVAEKRREEGLWDEYEVVRVMWPELDYPVAICHAVRRALIRARARRAA